MQTVYLLISHTNGPQVKRFAEAILGSSPAGVVVVLHAVDGEAPDLAPHVAAGRAHVVPYGPPVRWGDFSLTAKVLYGMQWVREHTAMDWLVLLSGQDYLLRPLPALEASLAATEVDAFLSGAPIAGGRPCGPVDCNLLQQPGPSCRRCERLYLYQYRPVPQGGLVGRLLRRATSWAAATSAELPLLRLQAMPAQAGSQLVMMGIRAQRSPFNEGFQCAKGSLWFTASARAVATILDFCDTRADVLAYYRRTILPDESLFLTVWNNTPGLKVAPDSERFVNWLDVRSPSPAAIRAEDVERVVASGASFARKFDAAVDPLTLDLIDRYRSGLLNAFSAP